MGSLLDELGNLQRSPVYVCVCVFCWRGGEFIRHGINIHSMMPITNAQPLLHAHVFQIIVPIQLLPPLQLPSCSYDTSCSIDNCSQKRPKRLHKGAGTVTVTVTSYFKWQNVIGYSQRSL